MAFFVPCRVLLGFIIITVSDITYAIVHEILSLQDKSWPVLCFDRPGDFGNPNNSSNDSTYGAEPSDGYGPEPNNSSNNNPDPNNDPDPNDDDNNSDSDSETSTETITLENRVRPSLESLQREVRELNEDKITARSDLEDLQFYTESDEGIPDSAVETYKEQKSQYFNDNTSVLDSLNSIKQERAGQVSIIEEKLRIIENEIDQIKEESRWFLPPESEENEDYVDQEYASEDNKDWLYGNASEAVEDNQSSNPNVTTSDKESNSSNDATNNSSQLNNSDKYPVEDNIGDDLSSFFDDIF